VHLVPARAGEERRRIGPPLVSGGQRCENAAHPLGIGARGNRRILGAAKLGRGHELHRLGDLLGRLDRGDPVLEVF